MSEHGHERGQLSYADAAALVRALTADKVHGLCIVTDTAAARLAAHTPLPNGDKPKATKKGGARRKSAKS
ncbi:MAG: hypothetical protein QOE33_1146 [Acidobacteriota bacterium]|nr:hypothetical protein [Acidobacteriota bacterium]